MRRLSLRKQEASHLRLNSVPAGFKKLCDPRSRGAQVIAVARCNRQVARPHGRQPSACNAIPCAARRTSSHPRGSESQYHHPPSENRRLTSLGHDTILAVLYVGTAIVDC